MTKLIIFLIFGFAYLKISASMLCQDVDVRNNFNETAKLENCTVVLGYVKFILFDNTDVGDFQNISFPKLVDVKGFLMVYHVKGLTSVGKLFPNLAVIRGDELFLNCSLIIFGCSNLMEIGLRSLHRIEKGSIKIASCPNLCHAQTVNWTQIAPLQNVDIENNNPNCTDVCPENCKSCWNNETCHFSENNCHKECIGCKGPKDNECVVCKNYEEGERCVASCSKNTLVHTLLPTCVTEEECPSYLPGLWKAYDKRCVKMCNGTKIDGYIVPNDLDGCIYMNGSLIIRINGRNATLELREKLKSIEEINGYVRIFRSPSLTSLDIFENLKIIHGNELYNNNFSLVVYENHNLHELWKWDQFSIVIEKGNILFHYNSQLCPMEIERLGNVTNIDFSEYDVSYYSNGDKKSCYPIQLNVVVQTEAYSVTMSWDKYFVHNNNTIVIGYVIYYIQDQFGNLTIVDERGECDETDWESIFVFNSTSVIITDLNAYTQYAYYIKVYTTSFTEGGLTNVKHFKTNSSEPDLINNSLVVISASSSTITLSWSKPIFSSGIINQHNLSIYYIEDDETFLAQRDFCVDPRVEEECSCNSEDEKTPKETLAALTYKTEIESLFTPKFDLDKYMYAIEKPNRVRRKRDAEPKTWDVKIMGENITSYVVPNLKHFSMYVFALSACVNVIQCSGIIFVYARTLPKPEADNILQLSIGLKGTNVTFYWLQPESPNALIVAYNVQVQKLDLPIEEPFNACISKENFVSLGFKYPMVNLLEGEYQVRLQAVSLAGPGNFTRWVKFHVYVPHEMSVELITVVSVIFIVSIVVGILYYRYYNQNKSQAEENYLISELNFENSTGENVEDDLEVNREDIEIVSELARGSLSVVFTGRIKSTNVFCAIRIPRRSVTTSDKLQFLKEACIMKPFNDCNHVVKILGFVTKGSPPLLITELMPRGNLKTFLKQARSTCDVSSSQMYRMAAEIADGMMYLASKKFIHKDLAARNCMLSTNKTVKIGDFGLSHELFPSDYYKKGASGLLPVRWMAPESLADGVFTTDSDIWSYGVLLWEIVTLAEMPYQKLTNEQVLQFVISQGTLYRPVECPELLYELMIDCWKWKPYHRPMFCDIVEKLESYAGQNFWMVSFYHSSASEKCKLNKSRIYNAPAFVAPFSINTAVYWDTSFDEISI